MLFNMYYTQRRQILTVLNVVLIFRIGIYKDCSKLHVSRAICNCYEVMRTEDSCGRYSEPDMAGLQSNQCSLINSDMAGMCA